MLENASNQSLFEAWQQGDQNAARVLVRRYMVRLTALARSRLSRKLARRIDSEDIVMSVWRSFFAAAGRDQVAVPENDDLWPLLVTMTVRKLARQSAKHLAERRSLQREVAWQSDSFAEIVAQDPTPQEAAVLTDELEQLMAKLAPQDRGILTLRLQGDLQSDIARALGCSERTVRRAMTRIREVFMAASDETTVLELDVGEASSPSTQQTAAASQTSNEVHAATFRFKDILLQKQIGYGTFGKVYRAVRRADGETVAIKFLRRGFWSDVEAAARLIRESQMVSSLEHPGIVRHHGWGQTPHGAFFAMMDWVDGPNLSEWRAAERPLLIEVVGCGIAMCAAVDAAHQSNIIHCDLAPRNVLRVQADGRFVLTDFGYSQWIGESRVSKVSGTPGFLAPEQLSDAFGDVSRRTDVFGIGALLYFLIAGRAPIDGRDIPEIIAKSLSANPVEALHESQPEVPRSLSHLVSTCLSKEAAARPESVLGIMHQLESIRLELSAHPDKSD